MEPRPEGPWGSLGGTRVVVMSGRGPEVAGEAMSPMGGGGGDAAGLTGLPLSHGHTHAISQGGACQDQTCEGRGGWEAAGQEESRESRSWRRPLERGGHFHFSRSG